MAAAAIVLPPLAGWPPVVRFSAVLAPVFAIAAVTSSPWRWSDEDWEQAFRWEPSPRAVGLSAVAAALLLFWIVFSRFQAGDINAVDFTIYFDRPLFQTSRGRPLFVETTDDPRFSHLTHLAVHAYWVLIPLAALYWVHATPLWLLALSVVAVVAGAVHVLRIARQLGACGILACATALVYVLNDNTARTLNYGFHVEVLYAWFVPWLLDAGLRGHTRSVLAAAVLCVLVKEDACFPLFAAAVALALARGRQMTRTERVLVLVVPTALAVVNVLVYYTWIVPALAPDGQVMYAYFWASYGSDPLAAASSMLKRPWLLVRDAWNSGFWSIVMAPHLLLPVIGWRWSIGILPLVLLYSASDSDQVRGFGIYYAIAIVPFLVVAASVGAIRLARRMLPEPAAQVLAAAVVLLGGLVVGLGYSIRPWKPEIASVPEAISRLSTEPTILVQSGLYPHAGYEGRIQLLTPHALRDPMNRGAAVLLASNVSAYPFNSGDWACIAELPIITSMPEGLLAVRIMTVPPTPCK